MKKQSIIISYFALFLIASLFLGYLPFRASLVEGKNFYETKKYEISGDEVDRWNQKYNQKLDPTENNMIKIKERVSVEPDGIFFKVSSVDTL